MAEFTDLSEESLGNNQMDTIKQAIRERKEQGPFETEVSFGGEADLHRHYDTCVKNPGHEEFIPVYKLTKDHLPWEFRDSKAMEYIRAVADLTVRVSVKYVSENRPQTFPNSDRPFPFYNLRGKQVLRTGTGVVSKMIKYPEKTSHYTECLSSSLPRSCECNECLSSSTPQLEFAQIFIGTAAHVVYDQLEGENTTCNLFYDKGGVPDVKNGVISLTATRHAIGNIEVDAVTLIYETHDRDLIDKLDKLLTTLNNLRNLAPIYLRPKYFKCRRMCAVISHPHGCSKQVSFGELLPEYYPGPYLVRYTTPTCPGSSGAPNLSLTELSCVENTYTHSGHCLDDNRYNYSNTAGLNYHAPWKRIHPFPTPNISIPGVDI